MTYKIPSFDAGLVSAYPMTVLPQGIDGGDGYTSVLRDFMFKRIPGQLEKRKDFEDILLATAYPIIKAYEYTRSDTGVTYLVAANGTTVQYWNGTSWVNITTGLTAAANYSFATVVHLNDGILMAVANGEDASFLWNGTTTNTPADMPIAKYLAEFRGRLTAAGVTGHPMRLDVADPGFPTVWDPLDQAYRAFQAWVGADDGQEITGLLSTDDYLLIGKQQKLYGLFGTTSESFAVFPVDHSIGVGSHWTMKAIKRRAYFIDGTGRVYTLEAGDVPRRISDPVQDIIDLVDTDNLHLARAAVLQGDFYLLSLPLADNERLSLVYDTERNRWLAWSVGFGDIVNLTTDNQSEIYATAAEGSQFQRFATTLVNDAYLETGELHFNSLGEKDIRSLFLRFKQTDDEAQVTLRYRGDSGQWSRALSINILDGAGYSMFRFPVGITCREFEFSLEFPDTSDVKLLDSNITYTVKEVE